MCQEPPQSSVKYSLKYFNFRTPLNTLGKAILMEQKPLKLCSPQHSKTLLTVVLQLTSDGQWKFPWLLSRTLKQTLDKYQSFQLYPFSWVLGIKPGPSGRATSTLNHYSLLRYPEPLLLHSLMIHHVFYKLQCGSLENKSVYIVIIHLSLCSWHNA